MNLDLNIIRNTIDENQQAGRETFSGLSSAEIGRYNRAIMFGDNDEAFPEQAEWSAWTD